MESVQNKTAYLPGRPIAEKIANELLETGVNFEGLTFGTYGDDVLHVFKQFCPDSLTVERAEGMYRVKHLDNGGSVSYKERGKPLDFPTAFEAAHYARGYLADSVVNPLWLTAPGALKLGQDRLTEEELATAIQCAENIANRNGDGRSHRAYLPRIITGAISEKRYAALEKAGEDMDALMEARAENAAEDQTTDQQK